MTNVISFCNARKRDHGDSNWLWAVWVDVDHKGNLPDEEPTVRGYAESKRAARSAAWESLRLHVPNKEECRAYLNGWAFGLCWRDEESDTRPLFSRCSIGKNKWQWVVGDFDGITGSGVAESPEAARRDAELQFRPVRLISNGMAAAFRRKQLAIERSQKTTDCDSTSPIELVYECHRYCGDFNDSDSITPHRIVKRTRTRIYVDCEPHREHSSPNGDWTDYQQRTFVLDRATFESTGKARRRSDGCWRSDFYAHPDIYHAERRSFADAARPECFVVLGVPADATQKDVKRAFRKLAKKFHPDAGGDPEEFKALYAAYEQAIRIVSSNA